MPHTLVKGQQNYNSQNSSANGSLRLAASRGPGQVGAIVVKKESKGDGG